MDRVIEFIIFSLRAASIHLEIDAEGKEEEGKEERLDTGTRATPP